MVRPILIAADGEEDIIFLIRSLQRHHVENPVHFVTRAQAVIDYLAAAYEPPALILLDLRMPEHDGFFALEWIYNHKEFRLIPVVMLSGRENIDLHRAAALGAVSVTAKEWTNDLVEKLPPTARRWLCIGPA